MAKKGMEIMITEKKLNSALVVQHNALTSASYRLSLNAKRIIMCFISQLKEGNESGDMLLNVADFNKTFNTTLNAREMKTAVDDLYERSINITSEYTDSSGRVWENGARFRLIEAALYSNASIQVSFSSKIMPMLKGLKSNFTKYVLQETAQLKSIYSVRLYELFKQYEKIGSRTLEIEEMREMFGLEKKYKVLADFKKRVISSSIDEINKSTSMKVAFEPVKNGRKITGYRFTFHTVEASNEKKLEDFLKKCPSLFKDNKKIVVGGETVHGVVEYEEGGFGAVCQYEHKPLLDLLLKNGFRYVRVAADGSEIKKWSGKK